MLVTFIARFSRTVQITSFLLALSSAPAMPQVAPNPTSPQVTFSLDFPQSNPAHYAITVDATGDSTYECTATIAEGAEPQPYRSVFQISVASRQKIFELARQAKYFAGKIDSGSDKLAFTGAKVLSYQDGSRSNTARYNYSSLQPVRDLTTLFQGIAGTLEYGRRLEYFHHYQKLALDGELKRMDAQARSNELFELQAVGPVLQKIADDATVINVVRARAKDLLQYSQDLAHR